MRDLSDFGIGPTLIVKNSDGSYSVNGPQAFTDEERLRLMELSHTVNDRFHDVATCLACAYNDEDDE